MASADFPNTLQVGTGRAPFDQFIDFVRFPRMLTLPSRHQVHLPPTRKREHSRKPDEIYELIERCSPGPYLELFARYIRSGWVQWGNEIVEHESAVLRVNDPLQPTFAFDNLRRRL